LSGFQRFSPGIGLGEGEVQRPNLGNTKAGLGYAEFRYAFRKQIRFYLHSQKWQYVRVRFDKKEKNSLKVKVYKFV
jgi:hypothetical protein